MTNAYFLVELSGDYPNFGEVEIKSVVEAYGNDISIIRRLNKFLLIKTEYSTGWISIWRSAYVKSAWRILEIIDNRTDIPKLRKILNSTNLKISYKVLDKKKKTEIEKLYKQLIGLIDREKLPGLPKDEVQVIDFDDEYILGYRITTGRELVGKRNPQYRPYAPSATMDSYLSRALVNFSRVKPGEIFLDPFAGSGSIVMEASSIGAYTIAIDKSLKHLLGLKVNSLYFDLDVKIINGDATNMPIQDDLIDAIATDPPYGRSAPVFKTSLQTIYKGFIKEASRILKSNRFMVFCSSTNFDASKYLKDYGFEIVKTLEMRVHSTLTRLIYITKLL